MKGSEALELIIGSSNLSKADVARAIGQSPQYVNNVTKGHSGISVDRLVEIADILGYQLVLAPRNSRLPKGSVAIGRE